MSYISVGGTLDSFHVRPLTPWFLCPTVPIFSDTITQAADFEAAVGTPVSFHS